MRKEFLIKINGTKKTMTATVTYEGNDLIGGEISEPEKMESRDVDWFWRSFIPYTMDELHRRAKGKFVEVTEIEPDLSFDRFWNEYGYKVGKKQRSENLWKAMKKDEKVLCLKSISKYKFWVAQQPNGFSLYPETYLSQKRWENEFKI